MEHELETLKICNIVKYIYESRGKSDPLLWTKLVCTNLKDSYLIKNYTAKLS